MKVSARFYLWAALFALAQASPVHQDAELVLAETSPLGDFIGSILRQNEIIGDVLDDFNPTYRIIAAFPKYHESVLLGNQISEKAVQHRPTFEFQDLETIGSRPDNSTFTLILTDPDATSRDDPKMSEMCHWIMTNLTNPTATDDLISEDLTSQAEEGELKGYKPPAPPKGTGLHRYVFVLLKAKPGMVPKAPKERPHWGYGKVRHGVQDWAKDNDLEVVGANFFQTMHGT